MRRLAYLVLVVTGALALGAAPASAHNAGCVQTGNGEWVFVGSNKSAPLVPEQNPHYHAADDADQGRLDLQPGPGDQYGARFAADQGQSAVERPAPTRCMPPPSRG
jgi:hypothetical protein